MNISLLRSIEQKNQRKRLQNIRNPTTEPNCSPGQAFAYFHILINPAAF